MKVYWFNLLLCGFLIGSIATSFVPRPAQASGDSVGAGLMDIASAIESVASAIRLHD
jgi:hypothetical protein